MNKPFLNDNNIYPDDWILSTTLHEVKLVYDAFLRFISDNYPAATVVWNYYNDGKAWLCKIILKKKTLCWLSAWDKMFKVTFYFNEKTASGVSGLDLRKAVIDRFLDQKTIGKLRPLTTEIRTLDDLEIVLRVFRYKASLK